MTGPHLTDLLDLDADVLHEHHTTPITWVSALLPERARIVDLGAGTGTGAIALARQLPHAQVVAVDAAEPMLAHLRSRADALGVGARVQTVQADLDQPWPDLGPADLVWMSAALHHLADPDAALAGMLATLRPGGLLALVELDSFPRFLTDPAGAALEERCHAELDRMRAEAGMHMGVDWGERLAAAGFRPEAHRRFDLVLPAPLPAAAGSYAKISLGHMRHGLDGRLPAADLAALAALAEAAPDRDDLTVRATRTAWLARRPMQ